jgi:hypothetical protein
MKNFAAFCLAVVPLSGFLHGASYSSDFDSLTFGDDMNGLDGWNLDAGVSPLSDVAYVGPSGFSPSIQVSGLQGIVFGFQEIDSASAYLYRNSGASLVGNPMGYTEFQAAFKVQDSSPSIPPPSYLNRDSFAFTFRGAANQNLLTIQLSPTTQSLTPQLDTRIDQYSWTSDFAAGNVNIGSLTETFGSIINVKFTPSGVNDVAFSIKFAGVEAANGVLLNAASQSLGTYGMVWNPLDPNNEGSNMLLIDDLSLVPEPSSALLLGLAGFAFMTRRKRA